MFEKTLDKLQAELKNLQYQLSVVIPRDLNTAAALGDLSENAEYEEARDRKRMTETRVSHLKGRIANIMKVDIDKISHDGVGLGSIVSLEDLNSGDEVTYEIVFADDVDVEAGKISIQSPVGKSLMGKNVDDEAVVILPAGKKEYLITKLKTIHELNA